MDHLNEDGIKAERAASARHAEEQKRWFQKWSWKQWEVHRVLFCILLGALMFTFLGGVL